jgi:hypothetical protein
VTGQPPRAAPASPPGQGHGPRRCAANTGVIRRIACGEWLVDAVNAPERQGELLNGLLDGFDGKLTSSKWAAIAKCSPDTALRDITDLLARGVLRKSESGGRSTSYELNAPVGTADAIGIGR